MFIRLLRIPPYLSPYEEIKNKHIGYSGKPKILEVKYLNYLTLSQTIIKGWFNQLDFLYNTANMNYDIIINKKNQILLYNCQFENFVDFYFQVWRLSNRQVALKRSFFKYTYNLIWLLCQYGKKYFVIVSVIEIRKIELYTLLNTKIKAK